ncbi:aminopeptidase P family protein [Basilea psittacipulmonis]|uniref:Peptidase M24 n=1 Tax=Basilea psittacipulmonis DSM 24701 TaxID=1072685 RepID=A0A077DE35_9BURK|nr:aminopeptidase P family protein [Basilea psittacipulmonis]AIL32401.1 hypothetical protein IX83_02905 [Basilea psittacipulmonis DSM 24701]
MNECHPLKRLQDAMRQHHIDVYLVYHCDPHISEYIPDYWKVREWLSGFSGSAGNLLVTQTDAYLWTDSRYWVQAEKELMVSGAHLMKAGQKQTPSMSAWIAEHVPAGATIAYDPRCVTVNQFIALQQSLPGYEFKDERELISWLWKDRPAQVFNPIYEHELSYAGTSVTEKLKQLRSYIKDKHQCDAVMLSSLDDIAYLLNLRGSDVSFNPVFCAFLWVDAKHARLFAQLSCLNDRIRAYLESCGVQLYPYDSLDESLKDGVDAHKILMDFDRHSIHVYRLLASKAQIVSGISPSQLMKSQKTPVQIAHIREAMEKDGAALCRFFAELEASLNQGKKIREYDIHDMITSERAKEQGFVSPSFDTIAGFNENGALPHYRAHADTCLTIQGNGLLLIDSGGQYIDGTTDITRVIPIGQISPAQKADFTYVLKAMIAMSQAVFPEGIESPLLDSIARMPLWQQGLDYGHGTGHGVGYFLNVHEGPQVLSYTAHRRGHTEMFEGMVTSNEPGLYREGAWGIRIENLLANRFYQETPFGRYLHFETLTLCPIDTRCIDKTLLSEQELRWLNAYHQEVKERLSPRLEGKSKAWLLERTLAI